MATLVVPKAASLKSIPVVEVTEEYRALAKKLGVKVTQDPDVERKEFETFLNENGIRVYPEGKVNSYLKDILKDQPVVRKRINMYGQTKVTRTQLVWKSLTEYMKPIPYPVLLTVDRIKERFGKKVTFAISDFVKVTKVTSPQIRDPFLRVTFGDRNYVVEHWDEPGFLPFLNKEAVKRKFKPAKK